MTEPDGLSLPMRTPLQDLQETYPHLNARIEPSRGQACYVADGLDRAGRPAEYAADTPDALRHLIEGTLEFDTTRPSAARIYDYLLGGKDNFAADRAEADKILAIFPQARDMAQDARRFLARAVRHVASKGVRQFIDLGAGLPTSPNVHEVAREVHPDARVVYVDHDPMVLTHAHAKMIPSGDPGLAAVAGDLRDPAEVMASQKLTAVTDLLEPVCVILSMALHFQRPKAARRIMAGFVEAIKPGSYVIASIVCGNAALSERVMQLYTAETVYNHTPDVFRSWFAGMEITWPGLRDAREWQPRGPVIPASPRDATVLAGVAVKSGKLPAVTVTST